MRTKKEIEKLYKDYEKIVARLAEYRKHYKAELETALAEVREKFAEKRRAELAPLQEKKFAMKQEIDRYERQGVPNHNGSLAAQRFGKPLCEMTDDEKRAYFNWRQKERRKKIRGDK